jgi:hypothetical protein
MAWRPIKDRQVDEPTIVHSVEELLSYRDTWAAPLDDVDFEELLKAKHRKYQEKVEQERRLAEAALAAVAPLVKSDAGYKTLKTDELPEGERYLRLTQSVLNKLAEENFDLVVPELLKPALLEKDVADRVVDRIFAKCIDEPQFAHVYAKMCLQFATFEKETMGSNIFTRAIVTKVQHLYDDEGVNLDAASLGEDEIDRARKKKLANVKLIGHLFRNKLLAPKIVQIIYTHDLQSQRPSEVSIEVAAQLSDIIGDLLMDNKFFIVKVIDMFRHWCRMETDPYPKRIVFLMMRILDLHDAKWVRRPATMLTPPAAAAAVDDAHDEPAPLGAGMRPSASTAALGGLSAAGHSKILAERPTRRPAVDDAARKNCTTTLLAAAGSDEGIRVALKKLSVLLRDRNAPISRMAALSVFASDACSNSKDEPREALGRVLACPETDKAELLGALSWTLTEAVVGNATEDCPKFFDRFAHVLVDNVLIDDGAAGLLTAESAASSPTSSSPAHMPPAFGVAGRATLRELLGEVFGVSATHVGIAVAAAGGDDDDLELWADGYSTAWSVFLQVHAAQAAAAAAKREADATAAVAAAAAAAASSTPVVGGKHMPGLESLMASEPLPAALPKGKKGKKGAAESAPTPATDRAAQEKAGTARAFASACLDLWVDDPRRDEFVGIMLDDLVAAVGNSKCATVDAIKEWGASHEAAPRYETAVGAVSMWIDMQ